MRLSDRGTAAAAAQPAGTARADGRANVKRHVGYYLVDRGRTALESRIGYRPTWFAALGRFAGQAPLASYLGAILLVWLLTVFAAAGLGMRLEIVRTAGPAAALVLLALFAGAAAQFAASLVNWLSAFLVPPRPTMRLDFSAGIPAAHRTLVVVPALLTAEQAVREVVAQLELHYVANQDGNLWFALLSDFPDAEQETLAGDQGLLDLARREIERLNEAATAPIARGSSISCIARGSGIGNRGHGWQKSANGASWRCSTGCCEAARPMPSVPRSATWRGSAPFAT